MVWRKVTGVLAAAAAGVLFFGSPAFAAVTLELNSAHVDKTASGNQCDAPFTNGQDEDGWHFVWPHGGDITTVTLTFADGADTVTVTINSRDNLNQDVGSDPAHPWHGFIWKTGGPTPKWMHLYVFTEVDWVLKSLTGSGTGDGDPTVNLSHTCAGDGTPGTPSSSTSTTTTTTTTTTSKPPGDDEPAPFPTPDPTTPPVPSPTPAAEMPVTGPSLTGLVIAGFALVAGGTALLFLRRRRTSTSA